MNMMYPSAHFGSGQNSQDPYCPEAILQELQTIVDKTGNLLNGTFFPVDESGKLELKAESISRNPLYYRRMISTYLALIVQNPTLFTREEFAQMPYKDSMELARLLEGKGFFKDSDW